MKYSLLQKCPQCEKDYIPDLIYRGDNIDRWIRWNSGELIQDVWPQSTNIQREQIQTGICTDSCWEKYLDGSG